MQQYRKNILNSKKKKKTRYGQWNNLILTLQKNYKKNKRMYLNYTQK